MAIVFWFIGLVVTSFTVVPILIILVFGVPTTRRLEKIKVLKENNDIIKRYMISIAILLTVFLGIMAITVLFFPNGLIGFLIGSGLALLFSLGKLGKNKNNISDYIQVNERHFKTSSGEVIHAILQS